MPFFYFLVNQKKSVIVDYFSVFFEETKEQNKQIDWIKLFFLFH